MWLSRAMQWWVLCMTSIVGWGVALADDEALKEILRSSKEIVKENENHVGEEAIRNIRTESDLDIEARGEWLTGRPIDLTNDTADDTETAQQRAWNEIVREAQSGHEISDAGPPHQKPPEDAMYVYISLSMPAQALREMFVEALTKADLPPTIFVLRGWHPPDIYGVVNELNSLFPEKDDLRALPNVQINPVLFRDAGVKVVPTFIAKQEQGVWGILRGTTSLSDAVEKIRAGQYAGKTFGPVYEIEEPDILALIDERLAKVNWDEQIKKAKEGVFKKTTGSELQEAREDDSYLVDLTIGVNRNLSAPGGEVFARQGETVNPFDYITVQRKYIFFDANVAEQREVARQWIKETSYATLITTLPVEDPEKRSAMLKEMGQPVHEVNSLLVKRFQLRAVPSIAYQEGRMLRVDVKAISRGEL